MGQCYAGCCGKNKEDVERLVEEDLDDYRRDDDIEYRTNNDNRKDDTDYVRKDDEEDRTNDDNEYKGRKDDDTDYVRKDDREYRRNDEMEEKRSEYTENDPLLPKVRPPARRYLQPTAPPLNADDSVNGDINERTAEVPVLSYEHDESCTYDKYAHHDPHTVVQLEPPLPPKRETFFPENVAPEHQDQQEKNLHLPIQQESPTSPAFIDFNGRLRILSQNNGTITDEEANVEVLHTPQLHNSQEKMEMSEGEVTSNLDEMLSSLNELEVKSNITSSSCDHNGGIVISKDGDLKLTIPKGAIKKGDLVEFYITTDLYGRTPFVLPSHLRQADLASPYYHIRVGGSYHFHKPVRVEFEHYAVVTACDLSHFQLFSCEDDDESFTMRPINCKLKFDNESWCTFHTNHFCSYCLLHNCKHPMTSRIATYFLKQKNFYILEKFRVEIWFSFHSSHCINRNKALYTNKGLILDGNCIIFEASSDKFSTNFFALSYEEKYDGWHINHQGHKEIRTKEVNFYNYYNEMKELEANEEESLFPPRFVIDVIKESECKVNLNTDIIISCSITKETKLAKFNLYVKVSATSIRDRTSVTKDNFLPSLGYHKCDINRPDLKSIQKFSNKISSHWKKIAIQLNIDEYKVDTIDINHPNRVEDKCRDMLNHWLQSQISPCWCHFVEALSIAGLNDVAEEAKTHLKNSYDDSTSSKMATLDVSGSSSKDEDIPNLCQFVRYLKDIPESDLHFFVRKLLPQENAIDVIKHNRRSGGSKADQISSIGKAFLNVNDPSWIKIYKALKEVESTECDDLADFIGACYLPI